MSQPLTHDQLREIAKGAEEVMRAELALYGIEADVVITPGMARCVLAAARVAGLLCGDEAARHRAGGPGGLRAAGSETRQKRRPHTPETIEKIRQAHQRRRAAQASSSSTSESLEARSPQPTARSQTTPEVVNGF
ncbi:MAG TPA: hypothetical protein VNK95_01755 [Caldilineaceae bacterium]|nr:hypothetical protein [Caldilineaceae bacterium]